MNKTLGQRRPLRPPLNNEACRLGKPYECDCCAFESTCCVPLDDRDFTELPEVYLSTNEGYKRIPENIVAEIRVAEGSHREIARRYSVHLSTVGRIRRGERHTKGVSKLCATTEGS